MAYENFYELLSPGYSENWYRLTSAPSTYTWIPSGTLESYVLSDYNNINLPGIYGLTTPGNPHSGKVLDWVGSSSYRGLEYKPVGDGNTSLLGFTTYYTVTVSGITTSSTSTVLWAEDGTVFVLPTPWLTGTPISGNIDETTVFPVDGDLIWIPTPGDAWTIITPTPSSSGDPGSPGDPFANLDPSAFEEGPLWGYSAVTVDQMAPGNPISFATWDGLVSANTGINYSKTAGSSSETQVLKTATNSANTATVSGYFDSAHCYHVYTTTIARGTQYALSIFSNSADGASAFYNELVSSTFTTGLYMSGGSHYLSPSHGCRVVYYHNFDTAYTGTAYTDYPYRHGHWKAYSFTSSSSAMDLVNKLTTGYTTGATSGSSGSTEGSHTHYNYINIIPTYTPGSTGMAETSGYIMTNDDIIIFDGIAGFKGSKATTLIEPLIRRWIRSTSYPYKEIENIVSQTARNKSPRTFDISTDSYLWFANIDTTYDSVGTVSVSSGPYSIIATRALTEKDFFDSVEPVWYPGMFLDRWDSESSITPPRHIYLRNLENVKVLTSTSGAYGVINVNTTAITEDSPIYLWEDTLASWDTPDVLKWTKVRPTSIISLGSSAIFTVSKATPTSAIYKSQVLLNSLTSTALSSKVTYKLNTKDLLCRKLPNALDDIASPFGIERIEYESNKDLAERIQAFSQSPNGTNLGSIPFMIGIDLGLISVLTWAGTSVVDLITSGYTNVVDVYIKDLPDTQYVTSELLTFSGSGGIYYSQKKNWNNDYVIFLDGKQIGSKSFPNISFNNGTLTLNDTSPSGKVTANYSYNNYTLSTTGDYVSSIIPDTYNVTPGTYYITLLKNITTWKPLNTDNLIDNVYIPDDVLQDIREFISSSLPMLLGVASWNENSKWFSELEVLPNLSNIPITFS
jgi:hypothetical protein